MQIVKKEKYTLIQPVEKNFLEFYENFLKKEKDLEKEHLVLQISEFINLNKEDFLLFLEIARTKKENGTSFVIVSRGVDVDDFPDDFNITPTITEAEDILEMEEIERELGF